MPLLAYGRLGTQHKCAHLLKNLEHTQLSPGLFLTYSAVSRGENVRSNFSSESDPGASLTEYYKRRISVGF